MRHSTENQPADSPCSGPQAVTSGATATAAGTMQGCDIRTIAVAKAKIRHLSPFRYPGGKSWLVPEIRNWVTGLPQRPQVFVEPFAGGAIAGLTVAAEGLADKVVLCEVDPDVAAVWDVIFGRSNADATWLYGQIDSAILTEDYVRGVIEAEPEGTKERAFRTILKNRCQRGGILAPGAGLLKAGEKGRGLLSRWYPKTLVARMVMLRSLRERVKFVEGDAFDVIRAHADNPQAAFLVDPPYSLGGKKAGARLYLHNVIDHDRLFASMAGAAGDFLMTYDDAPEVVSLADRYGLEVARTPMQNTHHTRVYELLIQKSALSKEPQAGQGLALESALAA